MSIDQYGEKSPSRRSRPVAIKQIESIEIDFLLLADWAETLGGKLYIQGGGWDRKLFQAEGRPSSFAVAAGILVPWNLTNMQHSFALTFETGDGASFGPNINGGFNMGRPAKSTPGQKFRAALAVRIDMPLPGLGSYSVSLNVNGEISKRVSFYVVDSL